MCQYCIRKFTLFLYCSFLVLLTVCSQIQNINKQNVNIADKTLTDYSFLSRYHYSKSKNYLKIRYRIRHWIPMFIGTPCRMPRTNLLCSGVLCDVVEEVELSSPQDIRCNILFILIIFNQTVIIWLKEKDFFKHL